MTGTQSRYQNSGSQSAAGNMSAPARRPGRRTRLERGLDRGGDEPRGLRVDGDVAAELHAANDLPGMRGRIVRADGGGLGHTPAVKDNVVIPATWSFGWWPRSAWPDDNPCITRRVPVPGAH